VWPSAGANGRVVTRRLVAACPLGYDSGMWARLRPFLPSTRLGRWSAAASLLLLLLLLAGAILRTVLIWG
jgi:hypothetical protein